MLVLCCLRSQSAERSAYASIDRAFAEASHGAANGGQCPTLTPNGIFWLRVKSRRMLSCERMCLQGIVRYNPELTEQKLNNLAGEAMCAASSIPTIVAAESCL